MSSKNCGKRGGRGKRGKRGKRQRGGAYGTTMDSMTGDAAAGIRGSYSSPVPYNHCGGSKGGSSDAGGAIFNNSSGYGFTSAGAQMSSQVMGGYAPPTPYVTSQCGAGRKTKKVNKRKNKGKSNRKSIRKKSRKNKTRKTMRKHSIRRKCRRCNKKPCHCKRIKHKKKSRKSKKQKRKSKKHHQKGGSTLGYSQFNSNTPTGSSYEMPASEGPLPALANGGFNKTDVNCTDNYNHYLR